jgi:hypothetical protein
LRKFLGRSAPQRYHDRRRPSPFRQQANKNEAGIGPRRELLNEAPIGPDTPLRLDIVEDSK